MMYFYELGVTQSGKNTEYFSLVEQASAEGQRTESNPRTPTFAISWFFPLNLEILFSSTLVKIQAKHFYSLDCVHKKVWEMLDGFLWYQPHNHDFEHGPALPNSKEIQKLS